MITDSAFNAWLAKDGEIRCVLVEVEAFSGDTVVTRYLSNTHFDSRPSDSPANQGYDDILIAVPRFKSSIGEALGGITLMSIKCRCTIATQPHQFCHLASTDL